MQTQPSPALPDGRAPALEIVRGTTRLLGRHGLYGVTEFTLANHRRADIAALNAQGEIWIVEVKSCLNDFRTDAKWPEYQDFCDRFFFAVNEAFPADVIPESAGLIIADAFGGAIVRMATPQKLAPARRKAVTLRLARLAALRLGAGDEQALTAEPWSG